MALRNLTIGNSDFERMRLNDRIYVDKTQFVPMLRSKGEFYFFSRPRRFGKTMFLCMLKAYFQGRRELFKDLALDHDPHWGVYPIWHFSMGQYEDLKTPEAFDSAFASDLEAQMIMSGLEVKQGGTANQLLRDGFKQLFLKKQKVVILIDEYDKPLIDSLEQPSRARAFHDYLSSFYGIRKHQAEAIEFLFITGITRFEKLNIFSRLNQLQDITLDRDFHPIAGFTETEIRKYYGEYIQQRSRKKRCSEEALLEELAT